MLEPTFVAEGVSTHSRPKAAAVFIGCFVFSCNVSTHSRPKAAANPVYSVRLLLQVSTHSRPKAAAYWSR